MTTKLSSWLAIALTTMCLTPAWAQQTSFDYADEKDRKEVEEVSGVEWKASAQAGMILTTGNSETTALSTTAKVTRRAKMNRFLLEAGGAYARSRIFLAADANGSGTIDSAEEIDEQSVTTTRSWLVRGRYDRFLTDHNSLYAMAIASADAPAGKDFVGGGQAGYSRLLFERPDHEVVAEVGYDLSYEDLSVGDAVVIHSLRLFTGYAGKLGKDTGLDGSIELLLNANPLDTPTGKAAPLEDTRAIAKLGLTTTPFERVSLRFGVEARFDNVPAPRPALGIPYGGGFVPVADELDTRTELTLIVNLL